MGRSRYQNTPVIDGRHYGTWRLPVRGGGFRELNLLEGVRTFEYEYKRGDRLDHLAAKHWGDSSYWWVIALVNNISYPFPSGGLTYGKILKIPFDVKDVLEKILG